VRIALDRPQLRACAVASGGQQPGGGLTGKALTAPVHGGFPVPISSAHAAHGGE